jgi:hypothetical protein
MNEYKVEFQLEESLLYVRVSGRFPNEKLEQPGNSFQRIIDACAACQRNKILIDSRELLAKFSTIELFRAGTDAVSLTSAGIWLAILTREDLHDAFFEDVVANRGGHIGVFMDMEEARAWLEKFPTGMPKNILPELAAEPAFSR